MIQFSVVMPVYGVELYVRDSINSVLQQTYPVHEIILVNDHSRDQSPEICDYFAHIHNHVQVIHLEHNMGVSHARNIGLQHASGDYILFIDSDDTIDDNLLERVALSLLKNPADVSIYGLVEAYCNRKGQVIRTNQISPECDRYLNEVQDIRDLVIDLEQNTLLGYPWNKVYSVSYLKEHGCKFPSYSLNEDILFNIDVMRYIKSMNLLAFTPYHYMKRDTTSLTNKYLPNYYNAHRRKIEALYHLHQDWYKDQVIIPEHVMQVISLRYVRYIYSALMRTYDSRANMDRSKRRKFLQSIYKDMLYQTLESYMRSEKMMERVMIRLLQKRSNLVFVLGYGLYLTHTYAKGVYRMMTIMRGK